MTNNIDTIKCYTNLLELVECTEMHGWGKQLTYIYGDELSDAGIDVEQLTDTEISHELTALVDINEEAISRYNLVVVAKRYLVYANMLSKKDDMNMLLNKFNNKTKGMSICSAKIKIIPAKESLSILENALAVFDLFDNWEKTETLNKMANKLAVKSRGGSSLLSAAGKVKSVLPSSVGWDDRIIQKHITLLLKHTDAIVDSIKTVKKTTNNTDAKTAGAYNQTYIILSIAIQQMIVVTKGMLRLLKQSELK